MSKYFKLSLISFTILFLELLLIRFIGTEIRIFAYLSNLMLLAIFIGSGLGMLLEKKFPLYISAISLLVLVFIVDSGWFRTITDLLSPLNEEAIWFPSAGSFGGILIGLLLTVFLFSLVLFIFIPLGRFLGDLFEKPGRAILAYSINVAASLIGIWAFYGMSWLIMPPVIGVAVAQLFLLVLSENKKCRFVILLSLIMTAAFAFGAENNLDGQFIKTVWSPYQKLTLLKNSKYATRSGDYLLKVNGVFYMGLYDFSDKRRVEIEKEAKKSQRPESYDIRFADQYRLPYILKPDIRDVLIVGAGGGNDIAAAVRAGAESVDAVEIDPQIVSLGRQYHPEKPYSSPAVRVTIDDGRAFFRKTRNKYDLAVMGLADSHTLSSSLTNLRLDHYLYTRESFEEIKKILKPDGLIYLSFEANQPIGAKIEKTLESVFGREAVIFHMDNTAFFGPGGVIFMVGDSADIPAKYLNQNADFKKFVEKNTVKFNTAGAKTLSDDWPYLYLDKARIPKIHLWISVFLIGVFLIFKKFMPWRGKFRWDMFSLGGGFLLYEFQNVSKTSLLFGNTWVTNLFTISAILLFILLANLIQAKRPISLKFAYAGLILSFAAQLIVPVSAFNSLSFYPRAILAPLFLNLPLFFSGAVFISLFRDAKEKSAALAANLIGSAAGGMLEIFSFLLGIQSLLFIALALYLLSLSFAFKRG